VQQSRNFYGVLNVEYDQDTMPARYELTHGQIQHGCQFDITVKSADWAWRFRRPANAKGSPVLFESASSD
jgi:hypothetical protein